MWKKDDLDPKHFFADRTPYLHKICNNFSSCSPSIPYSIFLSHLFYSLLSPDLFFFFLSVEMNGSLTLSEFSSLFNPNKSHAKQCKAPTCQHLKALNTGCSKQECPQHRSLGDKAGVTPQRVKSQDREKS